jgi:redox-sensitive bicupin YhaK (pirin superfamily)
MITIRKAAERGHFDHGWLDTSHTFSFGRYHDAQHMGFRALRVINEDYVRGGMGFPTHPHSDMEIITYVIDGALAHKDSTGVAEDVKAGEVAVMSAGSGITHSEYNGSPTETTHFLQIWILPERKGIAPRQAQKYFTPEEKHNRLLPIVSTDDASGALKLHQDVTVFASLLEAGQTLQHEIKPGRYGWLQVLKGDVELNGQSLQAGDGAAVSEEARLQIGTQHGAEFLLFDLN